MKRIAIAVLLMVSGCGDNNVTSPLGIELGGSTDDFKNKVNVINEEVFPDTAPAKMIKFDSPPKPLDSDVVSYEVQTRNGKVIAIFINSKDSGVKYYERKVKEISESFGASVASDAGVTNESKAKSSPFQCALQRSCGLYKYTLFVSDGNSALIGLDSDDVSISYSKDDEMNKSLGR